jgi:type II protein arginine methyltransferase
MLNDRTRGAAFDAALQAVVRPGDTVLDIGSGSGLLAMMAARAGARRVVTCERNPVIAALAREIIQANGLDEVIEVIPRESVELDAQAIGGRADVVISEIFDCGLLGEGVLPTLRHARDELLKPTGVVIPGHARLTAMLLMSESVAALNRVDVSHGFDVSGFNAVATRGYFPVRLAAWPHMALSNRTSTVTFDFTHDRLQPDTLDQEFEILRGGMCHGVAFWFELTMASGQRLDNSPENFSSHWHQAVQCFSKPFEVQRGDWVDMRISYGDSTIHFSPLGTDRLIKAGRSGSPVTLQSEGIPSVTHFS